MDWEGATLEQLEALRDALDAYIAARRRQDVQDRLTQLQAEQSALELELKEAQAQLVAQEEMARRLRQALNLIPDLEQAAGAPKRNGRGPDDRVADDAVESIGDGDLWDNLEDFEF